MQGTGGKVVRFRRGARRTPRWNMGIPPEPRRRNGRFGRSALFGAIALLVAYAAVPPVLTLTLVPKTESGCRILTVVDGDTLRLRCPGRGSETARLLDFDTPELFSPRCIGEFWQANRARWQLAAALWSAETLAVSREGTDRYDRGLYRLWIDGHNAAQTLIGGGLARPYSGGARQGWCADGLWG